MTDLPHIMGSALLIYLGIGLVCMSALLLYGLVRSWSSPAPVNCTALLVGCVGVVVLWGVILVMGVGWAGQRLASGRPLTLKALLGRRR